ncbi:alkene reductase [Streptomyces armeniacus]|uniref:Alkene reductase n=1 Tax=Streptomyces armeniacus TaxID=83291 RepID=A0A345XYU9_9ACTN|nr:alkene reductase [Streptomyces armeniacus]AXK36815.1 alkene reductase [Streptomyces armeniacus]
MTTTRTTAPDAQGADNDAQDAESAQSAPAAPGARTAALLRPYELGGLRLPNRVVMAPITRARATNPHLAPTALHAAYYAQRATAGLIVTEGTWTSPRAVGFPHVPGIHTDRQVTAWRRVTDLVHALGGRIVLQLWHAGANSHPDHHHGAPPAGPSPVNPGERVFTGGGFQRTVTPRELTAADIAATVAEYGAAARNARRAGFDGVEVAANGSMLLPQFLNPRLNHRTDAYGTRRERLLLEVVDAVAEPWDGQCVGIRLSPYWTADDVFTADARTRATYPYTADDETLAAYDELVTELNNHPPSYLHLRGPAPTAPGAARVVRVRVARCQFTAEGEAGDEVGVGDVVA